MQNQMSPRVEVLVNHIHVIKIGICTDKPQFFPQNSVLRRSKTKIHFIFLSREDFFFGKTDLGTLWATSEMAEKDKKKPD